jgi:hypothetical protein
VLWFFGTADLAPSREESVAFWWLRKRKAVAKPSCKGFDTLDARLWARAGFVSIAALLGFRRRFVAP